MLLCEKSRNRRGGVLVMAIVCVAIAAMLFVMIAQAAALGRRASDSQRWQIQASLLAESGLDRAVARLWADADYGGETWAPGAAEFDGRHSAAVAIEVEPVPDEPERRQIRIRADYPDHPYHRCREMRSVVISLSETATSSPEPTSLGEES